ncbi:hypothetical protein ACE38V_18650 [Cytobacillus sp. Hz8]|uniref:hypothetical protein n=1 Tax=Cytobacillus sp. Hz8 TaxID=3347168 RepID=UPI0035D97BF9
MNKMNKWNRLFIRQGFMVEEKSFNVFDCTSKTNENMEFLLDGLRKLSIIFTYENSILTISNEPISEDLCLKCFDLKDRGRGEGLWFRHLVEYS